MTKYINVEFVDTCESYSEIMFFGANNVAIPYINIDIMPGNPITGENSFIDYSYYILIGVNSMKYGSTIGKLNFDFNLLIKHSSPITEYIVLGNSEVKIECQEIHYYTFPNSKISTRPDAFIPYVTPNFKQTLDIREVEQFFSFQGMPDEIKAVLGSNISSVVWE